eukprot:3223592-Amphidinium_carterae.1
MDGRGLFTLSNLWFLTIYYKSTGVQSEILNGFAMKHHAHNARVARFQEPVEQFHTKAARDTEL